MITVVLENAPARLRGRLSLTLHEIRAGVFVGNYGRRQRERIWADVEALVGKGSAVMAWSTTANESGFDFVAIGADRRTPIRIDGFTLVRFANREKEAA